MPRTILASFVMLLTVGLIFAAETQKNDGPKKVQLRITVSNSSSGPIFLTVDFPHTDNGKELKVPPQKTKGLNVKVPMYDFVFLTASAGGSYLFNGDRFFVGAASNKAMREINPHTDQIDIAWLNGWVWSINPLHN